MLNITYTHSSNSGSSAKVFKLTDSEDITIDGRFPNQAKQIVDYVIRLAETKETFTYSDLETYIDENHVGTFTTSKGGTMRIIRYYSKLLQTAGVIQPV